MKYPWIKWVLGLAIVAATAAFTAVNLIEPHRNPVAIGVFAGKALHLFLFGVMWFSVFALGRGVTRLLFGRHRNPPELVFAVGLIAAVLAAYVLCAAHLAYGWLIKTMVYAGAAAGSYFLRREFAAAGERARRWLRELGLGSACLLAGLVVIAATQIPAAAAPPIYWDALTYHITVPAAYARAHGFVYLPHNVYASMPMGGTLFYLWPLSFDGLVAANACHFVVSLLAAAMVYRLARLYMGQFYAALAAAFVALEPTFFGAIGGAHVDHFQTLFAAAALWLYLRPNDDVAKVRIGWALAVGLLLGACLGVKFTGIAAWVAIIPIWFYDLVKKRIRWSAIAWMIAAGILMVAPWLAKAAVERGSPIFPLLYDVLGGRGFSVEQYHRLIAWQSDIGQGRAVVDYLLLPYRLTVNGDETYQSFAGIILPFLLPLAAMAIPLFRRGGRVVAFGWFYLLGWALGPQQVRFLAGAFPALAVAAAGAVSYVEGKWPPAAARIWRVFWAAAALVVAVSLYPGAISVGLMPPYYIFGADAEGYLTARQPYARAQIFINRNLPADAKVLLIFTNHTLYLERPAVYDSFLEASAFFLAAEKAGDAAELYKLARSWGVTHVLFYRYQYENAIWEYYRPEARRNVYDFLRRYGAAVYQDRWNVVYELVEVNP